MWEAFHRTYLWLRSRCSSGKSTMHVEWAQRLRNPHLSGGDQLPPSWWSLLLSSGSESGVCTECTTTLVALPWIPAGQSEVWERGRGCGRSGVGNRGRGTLHSVPSGISFPAGLRLGEKVCLDYFWHLLGCSYLSSTSHKPNKKHIF